MQYNHPMSENKYDWEKIKTEYVTGDMSQRELAEKYGVSSSRLWHRASDEEWRKQRAEYRQKVSKKTLNKLASRDASNMAKMEAITDNLVDMVVEISKQTDQLRKHIINRRDEEGREWSEVQEMDKIDMKMLKDLTSVTKDLTFIVRNIYGIPTFSEKEHMAIAREKLKIDKAKAEAFVSDEDNDETGVIILAPVLLKD